jgi:ribosomal protein S18 acetylase RimI-like enzyme
MDGPLLIRPVEAADEAAVAALWKACGLTVAYNDPAWDIAFCRDSGGNATLFVGLLDGNLAATVMAGHDGHRGWLYYVAVSPAHRRRGLGRAMVRHAEQALAQRGIWKVQLLIRETNLAVRGFYEQLGFEVAPRLIMSKAIAPSPANRK